MAISISSPQAAIAAAPYLLGFQPEDSLVILFSAPDGVHMTMRVDLPPAADIEWLQCVLQGIPEPLPVHALILAYADTADALLAKVVAQWTMYVLFPLMEVADALLVSADTILSLTCDDPWCMSPCGTDLESIRDHPVVAECVAAGMSLLPGRQSLEDLLTPIRDEVSDDVLELLAQARQQGYEIWRDELEKECVGILCGDRALTAADVAHIAQACGDVHVRDPMITMLLEGRAGRGLPLATVRTRMAYCLRRIPSSYAGPVAATLALLGWADGDGAAALVAAERALKDDPLNTLAPLVMQALQHGLPPSTWSTVTRDIPLEVLRGRRSA